MRTDQNSPAAALSMSEPPDGATVVDRDGHTWRRDDGAKPFNLGFAWVCPVKGQAGDWEYVATLLRDRPEET